jgi:hypothetical protein
MKVEGGWRMDESNGNLAVRTRMEGWEAKEGLAKSSDAVFA